MGDGASVEGISKLLGKWFTMDCHAKSGLPNLVPPSPNILKYLNLPDNFAEIFGPSGTKISELFGPP